MRRVLHISAILVCLGLMGGSLYHMYTVYESEMAKQHAYAQAKWDSQRVAEAEAEVVERLQQQEADAMLARQQSRLEADSAADLQNQSGDRRSPGKFQRAIVN